MDSRNYWEGINRLKYLTPLIVEIARATLTRVISQRVCSDHEIANIIAQNASHSPIPTNYLPVICQFVADLVRAHLVENKNTQEIARACFTAVDACSCYVVWHIGRNHYHYETLPGDVLALRDQVLFWIDHAHKDYRSRGVRKRSPQPRAERLLRVFSRQEHAGKRISIVESYQQAWLKPPPSPRRMISSVQEAMSGLNLFARPELFERKADPRARVIRLRDVFQISEELPNECCIITLIQCPV
jgi:hypothetical protein